MTPRAAAGVLAAGRIAVGAALLLAPEQAATAWLGREGHRTSVQVVAAGFGARELAIGVGAAWAVGQGFGAGAWLRAGAIADAVDFIAVLRARRSLPALRGAAVLAMAAGGAASGAWLAREVD